MRHSNDSLDPAVHANLGLYSSPSPCSYITILHECAHTLLPKFSASESRVLGTGFHPRGIRPLVGYYCPRYQQLPLLYWPRIDVPVLTEDHSAVRWRSPHLVYGALRSYSIIGVIVQRSPFRRASEFYTPLATADIIPENLECGWGKCDAYSPFQ